MHLPTRRTLRLALCAALVLAGARVRAEETAWRVSHAEAAVPGTEVREIAWQATRPPGGRHDTIELHRYRGRGPHTATLLYLPGTYMHGEAALKDEAHNLWLFLAGRGVEVYALDYRTHFVPGTGVTDFAFMRNWSTEAFVGDIRAAAEQARRESARDRLFVAGFSRGVTLAYAYACTEPAAVAGIVALDGYFKNHAPKNQYDVAADLQKLETGGAWATDLAAGFGWEKRQQLMEGAATAPAGPALDPRFPTVGDQLAAVLYGAWRPGALANTGMSRPETLGRILRDYDRYYPAVQDVDGRSLADRDDDPRTAVDDAWGELKVPVLYFGASQMGTDWLLDGIHSAGHSGSPDVALHVLEGYGHLDVIVGEQARRDVFEPTLAWILTRANTASR